MKGIFIRIILIITTFNVVTINQFAKVPLLIVHYIDHWQRDHSVSIADFIQMHYFDKDINDHDDQQDKQLPLKDFNLNYTFQIALPPNFLQFSLTEVTFNSKADFPLPRTSMLLSAFKSGLYRPPRHTA